MQYRIFSIAALAASVYAQEDAAQSSDAAQLLHVVSILQTALPSSLIQEALTNSAGVSSQLASEFAAGETPTWFTALPSDVQTYLVPSIANATAVTTGTGTTSATGTGGLMPSFTNGTSFTSPALTSFSSSSTTTRRTTVTESSQTGARPTGNRSSSSSEAGAAAMPTVVAMGMAGVAAGLMGVLAL